MFIESIARKLRSSSKNFLSRIVDSMARWRERRQLDSQEMYAIARELGLPATELCALTSKPSDSSHSLSRRLSHSGLSEDRLAAVHGDVLRDMRRVCSHCQSKARCAGDLRHERRATPGKYCPNEQTLRALTDETANACRVLTFPAVRN